MVIDFHTHCFPDSLAPRAVGKLSSLGYLAPRTNGTLASTREYLRSQGVDRAVVCNIATNPKQTHNVNSFAIEIKNTAPDFYPLGSLHPDCDAQTVNAELERLHAAGIRGLKLHPDYMERYIDDTCYDAIFSGALRCGMFVISHAGWDYYSPSDHHCTPERILNVLEHYPGLKFIAAHLGGFQMYDDVEKYLVGRDVWLDLSLLPMGFITPEQAKRIITSHSSDRLLFASDTPWCSPADTRAFIDSLGLDAELLDKIYCKNALALLEG